MSYNIIYLVSTLLYCLPDHTIITAVKPASFIDNHKQVSVQLPTSADNVTLLAFCC